MMHGTILGIIRHGTLHTITIHGTTLLGIAPILAGVGTPVGTAVDMEVGMLAAGTAVAGEAAGMVAITDTGMADRVIITLMVGQPVDTLQVHHLLHLHQVDTLVDDLRADMKEVDQHQVLAGDIARQVEELHRADTKTMELQQVRADITVDVQLLQEEKVEYQLDHQDQQVNHLEGMVVAELL